MIQPECILLAFRLLLLGLLATLAGCGPKGPPMAPVSGTVTFKGSPLPEAQVAFHAQEPDVLPGIGITDSEGRYRLSTRDPGDGCTLGKFKVTIIVYENRPPGKLAAIPSGEPKLLIPRKYTMPDTSGLTAEVTAGGITANFDLGP